jgi:hypothetical protein
MEAALYEFNEDQQFEADVEHFQDEGDLRRAVAAIFKDRPTRRSPDLLEGLIDASSGDDQVMGSPPRSVIDLTADSRVSVPHCMGSTTAHSLCILIGPFTSPGG